MSHSSNHARTFSNGGAYSSSAAQMLSQKVHRRSLDQAPYEDDDSPFVLNHEDPYYSTRLKKSMLNRSPLAALLCFVVLSCTFWLGKHYGSATASTSTLIPPSRSPLSTDFSSLSSLSGPRHTFIHTNGTAFQRPANMKFVGILFYGRRQFVDVLDCYLRRNLAINGGMLDEIHFLLHTDDQEDINWLKNLVETQHLEAHYKLKAEDTNGQWSKWNTFPELYRQFMTDPDTIYVKIDDDLLYIDDFAIPELIRTTLEHPEAHSVVANNINNRWNYWHHHRTNAIYPYLAERDPTSKWPVNTWRASELPYYEGELPEKMFNFKDNYTVPFKGHRWLPLKETKSRAESISHTPWGPWLPNPMFHSADTSVSWQVVAQAHYSFFENLERGQLSRYYFGNGEDHIWNLWYSRWNINFFAISGKNVALKPFWGDNYPNIDKGDEFLLTMVIPKQLAMPVLVATRSIVSHFSFRGDRERLLDTDVLDRYRALANEMVCTAGNKKRRFGPALGPHHLPSSNINHGNSGGAVGTPNDENVGDGPTDVFNPNQGETYGQEGSPDENMGQSDSRSVP